MAVRVFAIPAFDRFARKARINDDRLIDAVDRADRGLIYADLGEEVIKQAVARPNEAAINGFRTIIGFRSEYRAFFLFGFPKNEAENITPNALKGFRKITADFMALPDAQMEILFASDELREIERPVGEVEQR